MVGRLSRDASALAVVAALAVSSTSRSTVAQTPTVRFDLRTESGQGVSPVYEGWYQLNGTTYALFGYYNKNLKEIVDVPVGPDNNVQPGLPDQAQPTRFFPGRFYGVFALPLPKDQPKTEVKWTLTVAGQTMAIPSFLDPLYYVFPQREDGGLYPGNTPPSVKLDAQGAVGQGPLGVTTSRTVSTGAPMALDAWVTDDGLPPPPKSIVVRAPGSAQSSRPQGLTVRWSVYRGAGPVRFENAAPALEGGRAQTTVTFAEPGEYMLHVLASDSRSGTMCCWTNGYVKVKVSGTPASASKGAQP